MDWLKHGDKNIAFFHAKVTQRKKRNLVTKLKDAQGRLCETQQELSDIVVSYFADIFKSRMSAPDMEFEEEFRFIPKRVTGEMNRMLLRPYTVEEIKNALFQLNPTKAPGLDGFHAMFFQQNWEVIKEDLLSVVLNWLNKGVTTPELNETMIVLVPKTKEVEKMEELRPISLCKVTMKVITKAIANRLKEIISLIISPNQSAFIQGRLISDNILVAHELTHFINRNQRICPGYMSAKLDLSKAFDRMEWRFLEKMLVSLGFAEEWVVKIMTCVKLVSYRIKVNEHIMDKLCPERGLRQGDPISPFLFLICAEWMTMVLEVQNRLGNILRDQG